MDRPTACYFSAGIGCISALDAFLPEFSLQHCHLLPDRRANHIIGWGLKPTSRAARRHARKRAIPYIALEDGFLRSLGLGGSGYQPHSMVVDSSGIYYDASVPSDLETLLNNTDFIDDELSEARACMALLRRYRLSKYNHAPDALPSNLADADVLVVDQTAGDASIHYGQASAGTFDEMLAAALAAHPTSNVWVKTHPDVISGKKQGHLTEAASHPRCRLIAEDVNPWTLFERVSHVYVVTSQLGFEALLAGKTVHCFGLPFYAGWGLTHDAQPCPRRQRGRRLDEVFAAAYLRYSRYANPYTGRPATLRETIALIADQRRQYLRGHGAWAGCGFSRWKRGFLGDFLGDAGRLRHYASAQQLPSSAERVLCWSSRVTPEISAYTARHYAPLWRVEDGFIRSAGLGIDLTRPMSLALDSRGIYYDPRRPSDLEHLLETTDFSDDLLDRARRLRKRLVTLKLSKYNAPAHGHQTQKHGISAQVSQAQAAGRACILVPGQVESDASIQAGSPDISTNSKLLQAVRRANPGAYILYKAHPDVISGIRTGQLEKAAAQLYDLDVSQLDITRLLEQVDSVHTMCSLTGFEALLRGRQVTTYGMPFYAGWGLTYDHMHCPRRTRTLSLDALVAGSLILYPHYVDPATRQLCNAETVVSLLEKARSQPVRLSTLQRIYRLSRRLLSKRY